MSGPIRSWTTAIGAIVLVLTVVVAIVRTGDVRDAPAPDVARPTAAVGATTGNPVARGGGLGNVAFYYAGTVPLAGGDTTALEQHLGRPEIVVTTPSRDERGTVAAIHALGAKAYRYVQFYWSPSNSEYHGIDLREHPEWAYCRRGDAPSVGRTTDSGATPWWLLDLNETTLRQRIDDLLAHYRSLGWDGVFFDRGEAATSYAEDSAGRPVWHRTSRCTDDPHVPGATFADAHVAVLGLAHANGLQAMMNSGKSPFDPIAPMRPDPGDRDCRARSWADCRFVRDVWRHLDLVLNETAGRPKAVLWDRTFQGNLRSERHPRHGRRTVALITTASLGGASGQTPRKVVYQWSRIKLFDLAVAVNTGDGGCGEAETDTGICNREGTYPELVDTTFGKPLSTRPRARSCQGRSEVRCVWNRSYRAGMSVVNVSRSARSVKLRLGTQGCRYVYDVAASRPLAGNRCVTKVRVTLPRWTGLPLRYSRNPW